MIILLEVTFNHHLRMALHMYSRSLILIYYKKSDIFQANISIAYVMLSGQTMMVQYAECLTSA